MSTNALFWALRFRGLPSGAKFVLIALADCANNNGEAFPSVAHIAEVTGQDRKSILRNMQRLVDHGIIEDTKRRVGRTNQVVVYRLHMTPDLFDQELQRATEESREQSQKGNGSAFGTVEQVCGQISFVCGNPVDKWNWNSPNFPANSPNFPVKSPVFGTRNLLLTSYNEKEGSGAKAVDGEKSATPPKAGKKPTPAGTAALAGWKRAINGGRS